MSHYVASVNDITISAPIDTLETLIALRMPDGAAGRARLLRVTICVANAPGPGARFAAALCRLDDVSAGTLGTFALTPGIEKKDSASAMPEAIVTGNYSVEPTVFGQPLWHSEIADATTVITNWNTQEAVVANQDQLLGVAVTQRTNGTIAVSCCIEWEEF